MLTLPETVLHILVLVAVPFKIGKPTMDRLPVLNIDSLFLYLRNCYIVDSCPGKLTVSLITLGFQDYFFRLDVYIYRLCNKYPLFNYFILLHNSLFIHQ